MKHKQKLIFGLLAVLIIASFYDQGYFNFGTNRSTGDTAKLADAYENRVSNLQVEGSGVVEKAGDPVGVVGSGEPGGGSRSHRQESNPPLPHRVRFGEGGGP